MSARLLCDGPDVFLVLGLCPVAEALVERPGGGVDCTWWWAVCAPAAARRWNRPPALHPNTHRATGQPFKHEGAARRFCLRHRAGLPRHRHRAQPGAGLHGNCWG
jgi:hypothetical protein